jgi:hypothetical protein
MKEATVRYDVAYRMPTRSPAVRCKIHAHILTNCHLARSGVKNLLDDGIGRHLRDTWGDKRVGESEIHKLFVSPRHHKAMLQGRSSPQMAKS